MVRAVGTRPDARLEHKKFGLARGYGYAAEPWLIELAQRARLPRVPVRHPEISFGA
jgi:hypothetical protein